MNKIIPIKIKYLLLFIVAILFVVPNFFNTDIPKDKVEIIKTTKIDIIEKVDSTAINLSEKKAANTVTYLLDTLSKKARIKPIKKSKVSLPKKSTEKVVEAKVYKDSIQLSNAKVVYSITSPSPIFDLGFKVYTNDTIVTNTIYKNTTKYIVPNVWFLNYEPKFTLFPVPLLVGHEVSIDYTIRGKLRLGAGLEYNSLLPVNNKIIYGLKLGLKL